MGNTLRSRHKRHKRHQYNNACCGTVAYVMSPNDGCVGCDAFSRTAVQTGIFTEFVKRHMAGRIPRWNQEFANSE